MARQTGTILLRGSLQGISFYKNQDGNLAKTKSSLTKKRWEKDPAFDGSRRAGKELGKGATAYAVMKRAFHPCLAQAGETRQAGRGSALFAKIIRMDGVSAITDRKIRNENLHLLWNWEGNKHVATEAVLHVQPQLEAELATGSLTMRIPAYSAKRNIKAPAGATHYQIVKVVASIDFTGKKYEQDRKETEWIAVNNTSVAATEDVFQVTAGRGLPMIAGIGIRFAQRVNEKEYGLYNKQFNVFKVLEVFV